MVDRMTVKMTQGYVSQIDPEMYEIVSKYSWNPSFSNNGNNVYARRNWRLNRKFMKTHLSHVVIGQPLNGLVVDHINGDSLDNRRENLRIVTVRENSWNRKEKRIGTATSKYMGVHWDNKKGKWTASIRIKSKKICLGRFNIEKDAAKAYQEKLKSVIFPCQKDNSGE